MWRDAGAVAYVLLCVFTAALALRLIWCALRRRQ